jgi:hypothetical protein
MRRLFSESPRIQTAGVLLPALVAAAVLIGTGRFDLPVAPGSAPLYHRGEHQPPWNLADERLDGAWAVSPDSLRLAPGQSGTITLDVPREPGTRLALTLTGQRGAHAHLAVAMSEDGRTVREIARDPLLGPDPLEFAPEQDRRAPMQIKFTASVDAQASPDDALTLTMVRLVGRTSGRTVTNIPLAALLVLTPMIAFFIRCSEDRHGAMAYGMSVAAGMALLGWLVLSPDAGGPTGWQSLFGDRRQEFYMTLPGLLLLGLWGWRLRAWEGAHPWTDRWGWCAVLGALAWGGSRRVLELATVWGSKLDTDTLGYMTLARHLQSPYDTGTREPLYIWMLAGWSALAGMGEWQVRLLSLMCSLGLIAAAYVFFRAYTGRVVLAALVAWLLSRNSYLVGLSVRGLRDEVFALLVLAVAAAVFAPHRRLSLRGQAALLALAGAAAQLLRLTSLTFILPLTLLWTWQRGWRKSWAPAAGALLFVVVVFVPHLAHNSRTFGDPFYSANLHAKFFRNTEFVLVQEGSCEGCPAKEDLARDREAGRTITPLAYLFGMHGAGEVAAKTLESYGTVYLSPTWWFESQVGTRTLPAFALYLFGLGCVLAGPHRIMPGLIVLVANLTPFMLPFGLEPRHLIQTAPFATFVLAAGTWTAIEWLLTRTATAGRPGEAPVPATDNGLSHGELRASTRLV